MIQGHRTTLITPIGIGIVHVILVFGLLSWIGYPLYSFIGSPILPFISLVIGTFLVMFVPVLVFNCIRLVVPLVMGTIGFAITIVAGLTTSHPEFATLSEDVLIVGTSYVNIYASGWYIWLLAYGLCGVCEYSIRTSSDSLVSPLEFNTWNVPLNRKQSVFFGCVVGFAHTVVIVSLGIGYGGALLSGWLLGWGLFGMFVLGSIPILALSRYQLISPLVGLVIIQLMISVETLATISSTPVSSYMLFWPAYFTLMVLLVIGEYVLRWGHRKVAINR